MPTAPNFKLRPEERLVSVAEIKWNASAAPLTALEALQALAGAESTDEIGATGPLIASLALPANKDQPALRLYETLFGRDALISAYFLLDRFPALARTTLLRLAELQGLSEHAAREEEAGKIVHEARPADDPIAQTLTTTRGWQWPYYGSVDATPLFIILLARYREQHNPNFLSEEYTDRIGQVRRLSHALAQATQWLLKKTQSNPEGLLESRRLNQAGGTINQTWKDSPDSYHHADGTLVNPRHGIASIEAQAYAYDALLDAAESLPPGPLVQQCREAALRLRTLVLAKFWVEDKEGSYFALGSDRHGDNKLHILKVKTSNMGHMLNSRLLAGQENSVRYKRQALVSTLFTPNLITAHGIRTLAADENRYRPTSYHNGSVWPWDTFYISLGLQRYGFQQEAADLWRRIHNVITATKRFPEFVSGADSAEPLLPTRIIRVYDTVHKIRHTIEQPPQEIQAWTVAAAVALDNLDL